MMGRRFAAAIVIVIAARAADADPDPAARAQAAKLFEEGRGLAKDGDFTQACDRFNQSFALDPATGTELNLGDCNEHLDQLATAWHMFDAAARELDRTHDSRAAFARDRADKLLQKLVAVEITIATPVPAGLELSINKRAEPAIAEVHDVVEPGDIEVVATAPDRVAVTRTEHAKAGETLTLAIEMRAGSAAIATSTVQPTPFAIAVPVEVSNRRRKSWLYAAIGLGSVGTAAGLTSAVLAFSAHKDHQSVINDGSCTQLATELACSPDGYTREQHAAHLADVGTGFAVGSGALLLTGGFAYVFAPRDRESLRLSPIASTSTIGLLLGGSF